MCVCVCGCVCMHMCTHTCVCVCVCVCAFFCKFLKKGTGKTYRMEEEYRSLLSTFSLFSLVFVLLSIVTSVITDQQLAGSEVLRSLRNILQ